MLYGSLHQYYYMCLISAIMFYIVLYISVFLYLGVLAVCCHATSSVFVYLSVCPKVTCETVLSFLILFSL